jgi:hypothetical protein
MSVAQPQHTTQPPVGGVGGTLGSPISQHRRQDGYQIVAIRKVPRIVGGRVNRGSTSLNSSNSDIAWVSICDNRFKIFVYSNDNGGWVQVLGDVHTAEFQPPMLPRICQANHSDLSSGTYNPVKQVSLEPPSIDKQL